MRYRGKLHTTNGGSRDDGRGFVLPLTLWIIALMGLAIAAINAWVSVTVGNAQALETKVEDKLAMSNFENELIYEIGTRAMSHRGLEVGSALSDENSANEQDILALLAAPQETSHFLRLDGTPYVLENNPDYVVQMYDARGLLNLNSVSAPTLQRFLSLFDVPDTLRNQLPDTLADWIDDDDLTRLAGAEKTDYERLQRHPPSNANLMTPLEAQSILGWDQVPAMWEADLQAPLFTTCAVSGFNPNTAPETALLAYIAGLTKDNVAQILKQRAKEPFRNSAEFMDAAGVVVPNEAFFLSFIPAGCLIVDFTNRTTNDRVRFSLSLLHIIQGQPWQVDYAFNIPSQYRRPIDGIDPQVVFPTPETIYSWDQRNNATGGIQ